MTVNVAWAAFEVVIVTVPGLKPQVGMLTSPLFDPATEQESFTAPVNPPPGMTETTVAEVLATLPAEAADAPCVIDNVSVWPVPLPQPAVHWTTAGADAAEAVKFASPL